MSQFDGCVSPSVDCDYYYARLHYVLRTSCMPSLRSVIALFVCGSPSALGLGLPSLTRLLNLFFELCGA